MKKETTPKETLLTLFNEFIQTRKAAGEVYVMKQHTIVSLK